MYIIDSVAPRAEPVPPRGVWNMGGTVSQRRHLVILHITFVNDTNIQQDDDAGQNYRWYVAARLWQPYRSAFRRPVPKSDADDSGASLKCPIGDIDAVGEPSDVGG